MISSPHIKRLLIGLLLGAISGYVYYAVYGCERGCAITGNPFISSAYGAIMGGLLAGSFRKESTKEE